MSPATRTERGARWPVRCHFSLGYWCQLLTACSCNCLKPSLGSGHGSCREGGLQICRSRYQDSPWIRVWEWPSESLSLGLSPLVFSVRVLLSWSAILTRVAD